MDGQTEDSIPMPPSFDDEGNDATKKENAFWAGVISGVAIWVLLILSIGGVYSCKKMRGPGPEVTHSNYHDLPSS